MGDPVQSARAQGKPSRGTSDGVTLRARMSLVVGVALLALCAVLVADALLRARWDVALLSLPALGLVACVAVEVFLRPGIRVHSGGITVINPLRTVEVPWAGVADVSTRFQVVVETRSGRRIRCWGAPTAARTRPTGGRGRPGPEGAVGWAPSSSAHRVIEAYWAQSQRPESEAVHPADDAITRPWHATTIGIGAVLVVIVVWQIVAQG